MKIFHFSSAGAFLFFALTFFPFSTVAQQNQNPFAGGLGTSIFPYEITTAAHLAELARLVNEGDALFNDKYYILENNISLSAYGSNYNNGKGWIPIGHSDQYIFKGHFDGNNNTITNLYINNPSTGYDGYDNTGLFGWISGGSVSNLNVSGADITGNAYVGGIAGYTGVNSATNRPAEITNCCFSGTVAGVGFCVGGLAGGNNNSRIINCYATGNVVGKNYAGGLVGYSLGGNIMYSAALNQSVKATDAGANVARVACTVSGGSATMFTSNIAFDDMIATANTKPKSIINNAHGVDGLSRSGLELRFAGGFPSSLCAVPWVFVNGRLPGLKAAITKPSYLVYILATLNIQKDGVSWNDHGKTFTLKLSTNETISYPMTGVGSSLTAVVQQSGTWRVYEGNTYTGLNIITNDVEGAVTINYLTVSYDVVNTGMANGSTISATYDGNAIASGSVVFPGKQLVITAAGAGAATYAYEWSGAGTNGQTTPSVTIPMLASQVNAVCTVNTTHEVTFNTVNGNGTIAAKVDGNAIASGTLAPFGKDVVFTATPNPNYTIKEWTDNGDVYSSNYIYTIPFIYSAHAVTVEFEYNSITHKVDFAVVNGNGTLSSTVDGMGIASGTLVPQGSSVVFTASPVAGYRVKEWKVNGVVVAGNNNLIYTHSYLMAPAEVSVEYEISTYPVTFSVAGGANGTLSAMNGGVAISSGDLAVYGSALEFTAVPAANYRVKGWQINNVAGNGTALTYQVSNLTAALDVKVEFELIGYPVVFSVQGGNGTLAATVNGVAIVSNAEVQHGRDVVFTATPNPGYRVKEWKNGTATVNGTGATYTVTGLSSALTVTVAFEPAFYPVTFGVAGGNGSIAATVGGSGLATGALVQHGSNISFTATPATGYSVKQWKLNGNTVADNTTNSYTLTNLQNDADVTVEFEQTLYTVAFSVSGGTGTLTATADGLAITSGAHVAYGSAVVFTAAPAPNWRVKGWTGVSNGTNLSCTIANLAAAQNITVEFEPVTYAVTFSVTGGNGTLTATVGSSAILTGAEVQHGSNVVFTATPNTGYRVKEWKNGTTSVNGTNATYTVNNLTSALAVTVEFEVATHAVTFSVTGGNGTLGATVDNSGISSGAQVLNGKNVVFTANPVTGYQVKEWRVNNVVAAGVKTPAHTVNITGTTTVTVEFEPITYTITFSTVNGNGTLAAMNGSVSLNSPATVLHGSAVTFTAAPAANYRVKEWKLDGSVVNGKNTTYTLNNITSGHTVTVEYELLGYTVTFNVLNGNGTLTATAGGSVILTGAEVQHGSNVVFTAAPNQGYRVKEWKNGTTSVNGTNATYTVNNLSSALAVTVEFEVATHAVTFSVTGGNGTLGATVDNSGISSGAQVLNGKNVVFTANPANGYQVKEWRVNNVTAAGVKTLTHTVNITGTTTVTVEFEPVTYTITFSTVNGNGTLSAMNGSVSLISPATVLHGSAVTFTAAPAANYRVKEWKLDGSVVNGKNTTYTLNNITSGHTVTVEYELLGYTVTFNVLNGNGTLTATAGGSAILTGAAVQHGSNVVFTAAPNQGYRVKEWKNGTTVVNGTNATYTVNNLTSALAVTVEFEVATYAVTFSVTGGNGTLGATVDNSGISSGVQVLNGKNVVFTANPVTGYQVKEWRVNNVVAAGVKTLTHTVTVTGTTSVTVEFEPVTYAITFSTVNGNGTLAAMNGSVALSSPATVLHGSSVTFTATPVANYRVKEWKLDGSAVNGTNGSYTLGNISAAHTVTVEFVLITHAVAFSVTGGNGSISATVDNVTVSSVAQVQQGKTVVFTATPLSGFTVKEWRLNDVIVSGNKTNSYTLNNLTAASTVTVEFERMSYTVVFSVTGGNGSLAAKVDNVGITGGASVLHGKDIVFTATPDANYRVKEWRLGGTATGEKSNSYILSALTANATVTVEFELDVYAVGFNVTGAVGGGTIAAQVDGNTITTGAQVLCGKNVVFTATPPNNCTRVKEWRVNGAPVAGATDSHYTLAGLSVASTVTVEFETVSCSLVSFSVVNGNGAISATVDGAGITSGASVVNGKNVVFTASPAAGYRVKEWRLNNALVAGNTTNNYTISNLSSISTVTVEFELLPPSTYLITFSVAGATGGTLAATVDGNAIQSGASVVAGKTVVFTATAAAGYHIKGWNNNGTVNGTNGTYTITASSSQTVTVEFELNTYAVSFSVQGGVGGGIKATVDGIAIATGAQTQHGKTAVFTAEPAEGYKVSVWRLNGTAVPGNTGVIFSTSVNSATTVTVEYELYSYLLSFNVAGGNGALTATADNVAVSSGYAVPHGQQVVLTAAPSAYFRVKEWKVNNETVNGTNTSYTINSFTVSYTVTVEFEAITSPVTFQTLNSNGALAATVDGQSIASGVAVPHGKNVLFTATPAAGYRIRGWTDNDVAVNGVNPTYTVTTITAAHTVTVDFEPIMWSVTFSVTGSNGSLVASVDGSGISSGAMVQQGKEAVFMAGPANGYSVKEWKLNGTTVAGHTANKYTLSNLSAAATVTVEFEITTLLLTYSVNGDNGSLEATVNGSPISSGNLVNYASTVVLTASPNTGFRVKGWTDNGEEVNGANTGYTINNFSAAHNVIVTYEPIPYQVTFSALNSFGTLTAAVDGQSITSGAMVPRSKNVLFTAAPAAGYRIKGWTDNGVAVNGTAATYLITGLTEAHNVTVDFERITFPVTFEAGANGSLSATVDGYGILSGAWVPQSKEIVFMASPDQGYSVKEWNVNGTVVAGHKSNSYSLPSLSTTTVTVTFEETILSLDYNVDGGNGQIAATLNSNYIPSGGQVPLASSVVLTASPDQGYRVKGWTDNGETVNGVNEIYTINNFSAIHLVTVTFEPIPYQVTFVAINSFGTITATVDGKSIGSGVMAPHGSTVVFTAVPDDGYRVRGWTDNGSEVNETDEKYTVTGISAAHHVMVDFEPISWPVIFGVTGSNGMLSATVAGYGISTGALVLQGREIVFMASPENGFSVKEWRMDGKIVDGYIANSFTLPALLAATEVTVAFEPTTLLLKYSVNGGNGTLTATENGNPVASNEWVTPGASVVLTAVPNEGYRVKEWTDNGVLVNGANDAYTINHFSAAHTVIVTFERIPYPVAFYPLNSFGTLSATVDGERIMSGEMVPGGSTVVFTAEPTEGYRIRGWTDNGFEVNAINESYTLTGISAAHTVMVDFEMITFPVTFGVTGNNGSLSTTVDGFGISSGASVQQGKEVVFTAIPAAGYSVKEWKINGTAVPGYTANKYTLPSLSAGTEVTVTFDETTLLLNYSVEGGNGVLTATINGVHVDTHQLLNYGETVVLSAHPVSGYRIKEWIDNGETVNGANTIYTIPNFSSEHTVLVSFEQITYPVTFNSLNDFGTLSARVTGKEIASDAWIPSGETVVITAEPIEGYRVKEWKDNGMAVNETNLSYTLSDLDAAHVITVDFELIDWPVTFSVTGSNGSLAAIVDDSGILSGERVLQGKEIVFMAIPDIGYSVKEWKLNGTVIPDYTSNRFRLSELSEATEITVEFDVTILLLRYSINGGNGALEATVDGKHLDTNTLMAYGKSVVLTATPAEGYRINEWKDNGETVNGVNTNYTIPNFTTGHTVLVEFEPITYPVTFVVVNGNGALAATIDGESVHSVAPVRYGKTIVFTAIPDEGYCVKEWRLDGVAVSGNNTIDFTLTDLTAAASVTVEFEIAFYPVTFSVVNGNGTLTALVSGVVNIESGASVPHNREIEFTATPETGFRIKEWKINDVVVPDHTTNSYIMTLTATSTVTIEFEPIPSLILTSDLPNGTVAITYNVPLLSSAPVIWSIVAGSLPDGLYLSEDGLISGIPDMAGWFIFTIGAEDSLSTETKEVTLTVEKGRGADVAVPTAHSTTLKSIIANAVPQPVRQTVEYAISSTNNAFVEDLGWQDGLTFEDLTENSTYYIYARSKENYDYFAGAVSVSAGIITEGEAEIIPLKAFIREGRLRVGGLTAGKAWNLYKINGVLVYRNIATKNEEIFFLRDNGVFIIESEGRTLKVSYYGQ